MTDPAPIVEVRDLVKVYRSWSVTGRQRVEALAGVTLRAVAGEVFGLLGPNGAGKTTLIKTLLGVIQPTRGSASLFGLPAGSAAARQGVGYLPESLRIDPHHTARSALRFYGRLSRMDEATIGRRSDELLELVGLRGRDRESVRRFSKGMCQRLGLAQALMHDPDLLILDEPTDGLDPVGRSEVRRVIERLRDSGKTIFLNSHILQEVELVCTRVGIMARGRLRGIGTIDELAHGGQPQTVLIDIALPDPAAGNPADNGPPADAPADAVRGVLAAPFRGREATLFVEPLPRPLTFRVTSPLCDQAEIDAAVDGLRQASISILSLRSRRPTLEETFLRLVDESGDNGQQPGLAPPIAGVDVPTDGEGEPDAEARVQAEAPSTRGKAS